MTEIDWQTNERKKLLSRGERQRRTRKETRIVRDECSILDSLFQGFCRISIVDFSIVYSHQFAHTACVTVSNRPKKQKTPSSFQGDPIIISFRFSCARRLCRSIDFRQTLK